MIELTGPPGALPGVRPDVPIVTIPVAREAVQGDEALSLVRAMADFARRVIRRDQPESTPVRIWVRRYESGDLVVIGQERR